MSNILKLISSGESEQTEFKTSFQKEVIETVVAFANAKGGKVLIGINDNGEITGVNLQKETLQNWLNQIKLTTSPAVIPNISVEEIDNKKTVIIEVKEYPIKPINYKHKYLIRQANANHVMSMEEIANEYLKTKNSSWDYYVDTTQNFNDISLEKVEQFIQKVEINLGKKFTDPCKFYKNTE